MKRLYSILLVMIAFMLIVMITTPGFSQKLSAYKNPEFPVEKRVQDLLGRMTPVEKFYQLFMIPGDLAIGKENLKSGIFGLQVTAKGATTDAAGQKLDYTGSLTPAQFAAKINELQAFFSRETRLGIPIIPFEEALHGLLCHGSTTFPQSIGLAATFNTDLMYRVAAAIAAETRSRGIRQVLSPVLNIARDVRWGRTEETYGEDPCLVSQMGTAYISAMERAGVIATPKHFAVNSGDGGRDSYPVHYSESLMEEIYFPAFRTAVQKAGARSVMTAYNSFDGYPCTANDWLLNSKLKQQWGFSGFVISDACAVGGANVLHQTAAGYEEAGVQAVENGLDVIFQTDFQHAALFSSPFFDEKIRLGAVDSAVSRVLHAKFELGLFDNPYTDTVTARQQNWAPAHREIALQAARESIVLLKNTDHILPLSPGVKKIAVIGTDATEARPGGYGSPGNNRISILQGIEQLAGSNLEIMYTPGCGRQIQQYTTVPAVNLSHQTAAGKVPGLQAKYFNNPDFDGTPIITRVDSVIDFNWTLYGPDPMLLNDWYSVTWSGSIKALESGTFNIGIEGNDGYRLFLGGELLIDNMLNKSYDTKVKGFSFEKNREYDIRLECAERTGNARIKLVWDAAVADTLEEALGLAAYLAEQSDVAIVVAGLEEGEFRDRSSLRLPGSQEELISAVASAGKPVIVVLVGGSAVTMSAWINQVKGIVDVWYPGEAGGLAVAEVLFGKYNPAGRLPITFPMSEGQLPLVYNHKPTGRGDDYLELSGMPLFPFGFGLSYTTFEYSDLHFDKDSIIPGDSVKVSFRIKNTGRISGDEVCQLYIRDELASVSRPVRELKDFQRIRIEPGESHTVEFSITPEALIMLNKNMQPVIEPGWFTVMVGASSLDIRLRGRLLVQEL
jgi:beta-glucosidase